MSLLSSRLADRIVSLDIEGDGGRPSFPIEVGICEAFPDPGLVEQWQIKPVRQISPFATKVHGLRNRDLVDAPSIEDCRAEIVAWLEGAVLVGHGIRDDLRCLQRIIPDLPRYEVIDTLRMSRQLVSGLPSYSLGLVAEALDVRPPPMGRGRHSAGHDALLGASLFLKLCDLPGAEDYLRGAGFKARREPASRSPSP